MKAHYEIEKLPSGASITICIDGKPEARRLTFVSPVDAFAYIQSSYATRGETVSITRVAMGQWRTQDIKIHGGGEVAALLMAALIALSERTRLSGLALIREAFERGLIVDDTDDGTAWVIEHPAAMATLAAGPHAGPAGRIK